MADQKLNLQIQVNAETGQLDVLGAKMRDVGEKAEKASGSFSGLSKEAAGLVKSFLPFATMGGVLAFFANAVKQAEQENEAIRRLSFVLEANGQSWAKNKDGVDAWVRSIRESTRFSGDDAYNALEKFTRATGDLQQGQKASKLAMDLTVASGKPLSESIELITGLISGNERAVKMATRELGAFTGGATTAQGVLDNLATAVENASEKESSLTKQQNQLKSEYDEFAQTVGNAILPALSAITGWATDAIKGFQSFGVIVGEVFAELYTKAELVFNILNDAAHFSFKKLPQQMAEFKAKMSTIQEEAGAELESIWSKTTETHKQEQDKKLAVTKQANTEAKDDTEQKIAESNARLEQMELELQARLLSIGDQTSQQKIEQLNAEEQAELNKLNKELGATEKIEKAKAGIHAVYSKKREVVTKATAKMEMDTALAIADNALQMLSIVNAMQSNHTKAQIVRAKAILALEKAIAIAKAWTSVMGDPTVPAWVKIPLATAMTGLIVAQYAQQSKAIDQAADASKKGQEEITVSTQLPGGSNLETTYGGSSSGVSTGGGSSGGGSMTVSGGGGGGGSTIINIGPTSVTFTAEAIDYSNVDMIAKRLGDAVSRANVDAAQMALAIYNSGVKQSGLAR